MVLKSSVCIDAVFEGIPADQAIANVSEAGADAIEFWMWWEKDLQQISDLAAQHGLAIAACCTKFVSLADPSCRDDYLRGLEQSIAAAQQIGCPTLISQVGDELPGVGREQQQDSLVGGLSAAAEMLTGTGITLAFEPLNLLVDHAGYYLSRSDQAFEIARQVGRPEIKLTFDIYHQQITEGNLIPNITSNIDLIAHFHAAGHPGRHELNVGEINYPAVVQAIGETAYAGYFGLEYWPKSDAVSGLRDAVRMVAS